MVAMNTWPTDASDGSVATEARWRKMARHWLGSGVLRGVASEMLPSLSGTNLTVKAGSAWVDGHFAELTSDQVLTVTAAGLVVVRFDPAANTAELIYRDGITTPAQSPTGTWELPIARVNAGALIDLRAITGPGSLPWEAAWGRVSTVILGTASGNAGAENDINGASVTWTPTLGRAYSVGLRIPRSVQATSNGEMRCRIVDPSNTGKGDGSLWSYYAAGGNFSAAVFIDSYETGLPVTATTRKARTSNSGPGHTFDFGIGLRGLFWVADVGPAGPRPT